MPLSARTLHDSPKATDTSVHPTAPRHVTKHESPPRFAHVSIVCHRPFPDGLVLCCTLAAHPGPSRPLPTHQSRRRHWKAPFHTAKASSHASPALRCRRHMTFPPALQAQHKPLEGVGSLTEPDYSNAPPSGRARCDTSKDITPTRGLGGSRRRGEQSGFCCCHRNHRTVQP